MIKLSDYSNRNWSRKYSSNLDSDSSVESLDVENFSSNRGLNENGTGSSENSAEFQSDWQTFEQEIHN